MVQLDEGLKGIICGYCDDSDLLIAAVNDREYRRGWLWSDRLKDDVIDTSYQYRRFLYCREDEIIE